MLDNGKCVIVAKLGQSISHTPQPYNYGPTNYFFADFTKISAEIDNKALPSSLILLA